MSAPVDRAADRSRRSSSSPPGRAGGNGRARPTDRPRQAAVLAPDLHDRRGRVGVTAAMVAGSVALFGIGMDSVIEGLASVIVIWRFTGSRRVSQRAEERAERLVAIRFFLFAPYIAQDAIGTLSAGEHRWSGWLGIGLWISSIVVMPLLGRAKQGLGQRLGSGATAGEGAQNLLCAYLAAGVLAAWSLNAPLGRWWASPVSRSASPRWPFARAAKPGAARAAAPARRYPVSMTVTTNAAADGPRTRTRRRGRSLPRRRGCTAADMVMVPAGTRVTRTGCRPTPISRSWRWRSR